MTSIRRPPHIPARAGAIAATACAIALMASSSASAVPNGFIGAFPTFSVSATSPFTATATFSSASSLPSASIVSDATSVSTASGQSAFLGASTGFGAYFGSTRSQPYLSVSSSSGGAPSTTTFEFTTPLPVGAGFAVGDIDADLVEIIAVGTDSIQLTGAELGAQDTGGTPLLNYCNNSPKPSTCAGPGPFSDAPTWYPNGATVGAVTYPNPVVVGSGSDTRGAYDWFLPTRPISSLSLRFSVQAGFPTYQVWLAGPSPATTITGTIVQPGGAPAPTGTLIALETAAGDPVLDVIGEPVVSPLAPEGTFSLSTEQGEYQLEVTVPAGFTPISPIPVSATGATVSLGTITLAPTAVAPPPAPSPPVVPSEPAELADTGGDSTVPAALASGALLLFIGLISTRASRIRRPAVSEELDS